MLQKSTTNIFSHIIMFCHTSMLIIKKKNSTINSDFASPETRHDKALPTETKFLQSLLS